MLVASRRRDDAYVREIVRSMRLGMAEAPVSAPRFTPERIALRLVARTGRLLL